MCTSYCYCNRARSCPHNWNYYDKKNSIIFGYQKGNGIYIQVLKMMEENTQNRVCIYKIRLYYQSHISFSVVLKNFHDALALDL